jgi:pyridoxal phosphate enzyme (YggS family)
MARLIEGLVVERIRANLLEVREQVQAAARRSGRDATAVSILAASKYVSSAELPKLAAAGIELVGENRAQDLAAKVAAHGELFTWDFIGQLQSRRVRLIVPHVRLIHSVDSESTMRELQRQAPHARSGLRILIEVNVSREAGKAGVAPEQLDHYIERAPFPVAGLMTMAPLAEDPYENRRWFAQLRELAAQRGLEHLSMGSSQDYVAAVEEGATIVRIGTRLYA